MELQVELVLERGTKPGTQQRKPTTTTKHRKRTNRKQPANTEKTGDSTPGRNPKQKAEQKATIKPTKDTLHHNSSVPGYKPFLARVSAKELVDLGRSSTAAK